MAEKYVQLKEARYVEIPFIPNDLSCDAIVVDIGMIRAVV